MDVRALASMVRWIVAAGVLGCAAGAWAQAPAKPDAPAETRPQDAKPPADPPTVRVTPVPLDAAPPPPVKIPLAEVVHVEVRGTGPVPMVLIPGMSCDWTVFDSFMERNKERYTMYALTLPGMGRSAPPELPEGTRPSQTVWIDNAAAAVTKLIDDRKLERPVIMGHSLGGHLAMRLGTTPGQKARAVISVDGMPALPLSDQPLSRADRADAVDGPVAAQMAEVTDEQWMTYSEQTVETMVTDPARAASIKKLVAETAPKVAKRYTLELMASDATEDLKKLEVPMLEVVAISDEYASVRHLARDFHAGLYKDMPKVTVVYFEDTRHFIMDDAPAELDRAVENFIAGRPVEGKTGKPVEKAPGLADSPAAPPAGEKK